MGRQVLTFLFGHDSKQHHSCHQKAQKGHSTPDQGDAEGQKGIGRLNPEPYGELLTRSLGTLREEPHSWGTRVERTWNRMRRVDSGGQTHYQGLLAEDPPG